MSIDWSDICQCHEINSFLGIGTFGVVYRGIWIHEGHRKIVAVKVIKEELTDEIISTTMKEAEAALELQSRLEQLGCDAVTRVYGVAIGEPSEDLKQVILSHTRDLKTSKVMAIIMRYEAGGSLDSYTNRKQHDSFPRLGMIEKLSIAADIAHGK